MHIAQQRGLTPLTFASGAAVKARLVPRDWLIKGGLLGGSSSLTLLDLVFTHKSSEDRET